MKKIIIAVILIILVFTTTTFAEEIHITPENFKEYFALSIEVTNYKLVKSFSYMGLDSYDATGDVTLRIDSKYPYNINNVSFSIKANGGLAWNGLIGKEENLTFTGTMPQSGTYSSTQNVKIDAGMGLYADNLQYTDYKLDITAASGAITTDNDNTEANNGNPNLVADELIKLADLLEKGIITQEEFDGQKAKLLGD